jgi:hypothetical protein
VGEVLLRDNSVQVRWLEVDRRGTLICLNSKMEKVFASTLVVRVVLSLLLLVAQREVRAVALDLGVRGEMGLPVECPVDQEHQTQVPVVAVGEDGHLETLEEATAAPAASSCGSLLRLEAAQSI